MPTPEADFRTECPFCGAEHDKAGSVTKQSDKPVIPQDGDLTLCASCGEWAFFNEKTPGGLRKPTDEEYLLLARSPVVRAARTAWVKADEMRRQQKAGAPKKDSRP